MTKAKLAFSIDALMSKGDEPTSRDNSPSPVKDYSLPKSNSETDSQSGSPQPVVVPIPTFPGSGPSSSRVRPNVFGTGLFQRALPHYSAGLDPSLAGMLLNGNPYQAFPWFMPQRPRYLQHRYGPGPDLSGFLLPPFRKAKRIRTAFSASQLMKLEEAFDKNHYVTGNERKKLAETLGLTETQVKVWFQNRRTKAKRQIMEDRERIDENQSLPSSKMIEAQHSSSLSDPNLSPEQLDDSMYDDEDKGDIRYPSEVTHTLCVDE